VDGGRKGQSRLVHNMRRSFTCWQTDEGHCGRCYLREGDFTELLFQFSRVNDGKNVNGMNGNILDADSRTSSGSRSNRRGNYGRRGCHRRWGRNWSQQLHLVLSLHQVHLQIDNRYLSSPSKHRRRGEYD
jgi:hypothetical protein